MQHGPNVLIILYIYLYYIVVFDKAYDWAK